MPSNGHHPDKEEDDLQEEQQEENEEQKVNAYHSIIKKVIKIDHEIDEVIEIC